MEVCLVLGVQKLHAVSKYGLNDESGSAAFPVNLIDMLMETNGMIELNVWSI